MKRLNVKLALWLVGITVFSVVGVYFLHGYQANRNAEFLKVQAEQARTAGDVLGAISHYTQYVRHREDRDGYKALAELNLEIVKKPGATRRDHTRAFNILEEAIRRFPDLDEARLGLIDYNMAMRRFTDAQDHIKHLQENGNNEPSLELKAAACQLVAGEEEAARRRLFDLIGYDGNSKQFAEEPPRGAHEIDAFLMAARLLRQRREAVEADAVIDQMVEWNPDSAKAHLTRASYLLSVWETIRPETPEGKDLRDELYTEAKAELEKASEIEPDNADVMLMIAGMAIQERDFSTAQELLDQAHKLHPTRPEVYQRLAALAFAQGDQQKAAAELTRGLDHTENVRPLLEQLVEIQLNLRDLKSAAATCDRMEQVESIPREFIRYQKARISLGKGDLIGAMRELEQVRPAMERLGAQYYNSVNSLLGRCYEMLGMSDQQLQVYRRLLGTYPNLIQARIGEASALQAMGRHGEAENSVRVLAANAESDPAQLPQVLQLVLNQEMIKPAEERQWQQVEKIIAMLEETGQFSPLQSQLLESELLIAQGKNDEALAKLSALRKEHSKEAGVWTALCKLMASDKRYEDRLPQLISLAEKELGDIAALRAERIKLVARTGGEQASEELQKLESGIDAYDSAQQLVLTALLGTTYLQIGDYENGKRCLLKVMAGEPSNVRVRQALFDIAMDRQDEDAILLILKDLRESQHFGPRSATYLYCQSAYDLKQFGLEREGKSDPLTESEKEKLSEIRKSVDEALAIRGEWAPLWRLRGEVDHWDGDITGAISSYQRSLEFNRAGQTATARRLVALLYAAQRFTEANEALQYLEGTDNMPEEMRKIVQATKFRSGDTQTALQMVRDDIKREPDNPSNYLLLGELLENNGDTEDAEVAFRQAVEKGPKLARAWEYLIRRVASNNKNEEALELIKQAATELDETPLAMGRLHQRANNVAEAERLYKQAIAKEPDNLLVIRHLAELYLSDGKAEQAVPELDLIIEKGLKASSPEDLSHVAWARTQKARASATSRDYANVMDAVKLIEKNAEDGKLSRFDMLTIITMLAPRLDEPPSRARAIEMMELLRQSEPLDAQLMQALGQLYARHGDWAKARDTLLAALNQSNDDPNGFLIFAELLMDQDAWDESRRFLDRAEQLLQNSGAEPSSPKAQAVRVLRARLLVHDEKQDEAAQLLEGWLPRPLPQNRLAWLLQVAQQLEALKLYDPAERLYEEFASLEPRDGKLALAAFRGRRGDIEQSFALLDDARESAAMTDILPVALANLRAFPDRVNANYRKQIEQWARDAAEQSKDPLRLELLMAEMYDLQGRYDEVIKSYRKLLADESVSHRNRAVVQNNLAFILAAIDPTPQRGAEAQKLIESAIAVLGPTSDLLDTRALTLLAQGKNDEAASDLRTAVGDRPTTSKYYHLAQAEKKLGNLDAARNALAKAEELHGDRNEFTPAERKGYEQLKNEMN